MRFRQLGVMASTSVTAPADAARPVDEPRRKNRLVGMDGLRGIAAVLVVINHTGLYAIESSGGGLDRALRQLAGGVLLFFSLSGLLLYRPFAAAILGTGPAPSVRVYARNRFLRIAPAYWAILVVVSVAGASLVPHPDRLLLTGHLYEYPRAFVATFFLAHNYAPSTFMNGIGPAWTLAIEAVFYVALPVVSLTVLRFASRAQRRHLAVFVPPLAMFAIGLAGKTVAYRKMGSFEGGWSRNWPSVLARSFLANADLFAYGMTLAAIVVLVDAGRLRLPTGWRPVCLAVAGVLAVGAVAVGEFGEYPYDVMATVSVSLVLAVIVLGHGRAEQRVRSTLEAPVLVAVGLASYSLYLWHEPVIDWLLNHDVLPLDGIRGLLGALLLVGTLSGALSALTYRLVERPALDRKRPMARSTPPPS